MSKNDRLQLSRPGEGGGEGFHTRFSCKRTKRYVEFRIQRVITYIIEPHIILFFSFHIASSCNITRFYSLEEIPAVEKNILL